VSVADAWALLGIAPTDEPREVKRAYARVLKTIDPDSDPQAFKDLRAAYETALAWGTRVPEWESEDDGEDGDWAETEPLPEAGWDRGDLFSSLGIPAWDWDPAWRPASAAQVGGRAGELARELEELLFGGAVPDSDAVARVGEALLAETEDAHVDVAAAVEAWLVEAIASSAPRSDPLIAPALRRFGWGRVETEWRHDNAVASVLARRRDLPFAAALRRESHPQHRAFLELSGPPRSRVGLLELGIAADVRELLRIVDDEHPTVASDLDPDSLAWWRRYFLGPHLPDFYWLIVFLLSPLLIVAAKLAWDSASLGHSLFAFALLVVACVAIVASGVAGWSRLAGILRLRAEERRWQGEDSGSRKALPQLAAALVLPLVASVVQAGTATAVLYTVVALAIAGGLMIHAPPPLFEDEEAGRRQFFVAAVVLAAVAVLLVMSAHDALHLTAPFAVLAFAAARGGGPVAAALRERGRGSEPAAMVAAALLCGIPLALLFVYAPEMPPEPVLVLVPVAFVAQSFATSARLLVTPWLEWPLRVLAILFHLSASDSLYDGDGLRGLIAAISLYVLVYGLARIGFAARDIASYRPLPERR